MDPKRGYTPQWLKENGLTHDLIMTDDNIRIPLYLKYPESKTIRIDEQVGNIDIFLTILDILDIKIKKDQSNEMYSMSLIPLINRSEIAIERDEWQHSAFTISLIDGLENWEADVNNDGELNILDIVVKV